MYINPNTGKVYSNHSEIRSALRHISLPKDLTDSIITKHGFALINSSPHPEGDVVTEGQPEQQADGTWAQTWTARAYTAEEFIAALDRVKAQTLSRINEGYRQEMGAILDDYPDAETKTWDKQEQEARAWAADNTVATPLLTEIANARGMTLADLVPRIIAKADAWIAASGAATGKRQALEDAITDAQALEEVEAIRW